MPDNQLALPGIEPADLPALEAPPLCECPACGGEFAEADGYCVEDDTGRYCPECTYTCAECGNSYADSDAIVSAHSSASYPHGRPGHQDTILCEDCRWQCADCSQYFSNDADHCHNSSGGHLCERCAENYSSCEDCNAVIHDDNSCWHGGRDVTLCASCYREQCAQDEAEDEAEDEPEESTGRLIHEYNYKPSVNFHRAPDERGNAVFFGLEIETEYCGNDTRLSALRAAGIADQKLWYGKRDGSLSENGGVELVSHPGTWKYWAADDFALIGKMQKARFRSYDTSTCGMHVHISRRAFTDLQIWKLLEFFRRNEGLITRLSRRQGNSLEKWAGINKGPGGKSAKCSSKLIECAEPVTELLGRRTVVKKRWEHNERYAAINLENRSTVEIRIFRGTLGTEAIKRNIALCAALVEFVRYTDINNLSQADFVRFLATEGSKAIGRTWSSSLITWISGRQSDTDATC